MRLLEREALLERLSGLLAESRRGRGRLALVAGEAGIGKSALVEAFCGDARGALVLRGSCDPIEPPRPFGPLVDIALRVGGPLRAALEEASRDRVLHEALALLRRPGGATVVLVLEDLQWADDATLDLLRVVGRRLGELAVVVVGTYREDEVDPDHPLHRALGELPAGLVERIAVPPLSRDAVQVMARDSGLDARALYEATAGNPFYVSEVVAAPADEVPATVRDAVIARLARLSKEARSTVRAAAALGDRCAPSLLLAVHGHDEAALGECLDRGVLRWEAETLRFRHELARRAVLASIGSGARRELHRRALAALRGGDAGAGPDLLAMHAVGAGDQAAILEYAPLAGQRAASLGAHREAAAHFAAASRLRGQLGLRARAKLLEAHARECALIDDAATASALQQEALDCWRSLGDRLGEGACLRALSAMWYQAGRGERALELATEAVSILEPVEPAGHELALALATLGQRILVAGHDDPGAVAWASRSLELAARLGDEPVVVHALTTIGVARIYMSDEGGWAVLEEGIRRARAGGMVEEATRALINMVECAIDLRRYELAQRYGREATGHMEAHDFSFYHRILAIRRAELDLELGDWDGAEEEARTLLALPATASRVRVRALTLLGRLDARRGTGDPWTSLDAAVAVASPHELQERYPLHAARAEAAWLAGDVERSRVEAQRGLAMAFEPSGTPEPWTWAEAAWWAWRSGGLARLPTGSPEPYLLRARGEHRAAARAWAAIGSPYQEALALADSDAEEDLRAAHAIFLELEARPMARQVESRLRRAGARGIARGARRSTRGNPAGLTTREVEVATLLSEGLRNADIAERLVVSAKTVDHHVSSVLRKLGVADRARAGREAARLGLKDGEPPGER